LAATTTGIYLDDITFRGITYDEAVTDLPVISDTEFQQCAVKAYYSLTGLQLQQPERGRLVIERKTYPDGRIVSRKVVY
jgi:polygalacturonase